MIPSIDNLDNAKAYATEANLLAALKRTGLDQWELARRIFVVRRADGKWTAIFVLDRTQGGYVAFASQHGFYTV